MVIIDTRIHFSRIACFEEAAFNESGCGYSLVGFQEELESNSILATIALGIQETFRFGFPDSSPPNPMELDLSDSWPNQLYFCPSTNPYELSDDSLDKIEQALHNLRAVRIKLYSGYYQFSVNDPICEPVYEVAAQSNIPVVIHSGDTFSKRGLLKYSHPLAIGKLAVTHRQNFFVIAHLGDPWVKETAEIMRKNPNVWADISGLLAGGRAYLEGMGSEPLVVNEIRYGLIYAMSWDKILFGSDWPLAPMAAYLDFVMRIVPEKHLEKVLGGNASNIFTRIFLRPRRMLFH